MRRYVIRQGDYLTKVAHRLGFEATSVWDHPANAELRARRPEREQLHPGDVLHVPEPSERGLRLVPGGTLNARARVPEVEIRLALRDRAGAPIANVPFRVEGVSGEPLPGQTDGGGVAAFSVPVHVETCRLVLSTGRAYVVRVGHMDPASEPSGALKRLVHLGYLPYGDAEDLDTEDGRDAFRCALRRLQEDAGLEPTGEWNTATEDALVERHGS